MDELEPLSLYIASVYFSLSVITTVGYGDIHANTTSIIYITNVYN
jgi:hypothetical protein